MILETIAVHRAKRLDFGNQMATFPTLLANLGSKPGPITSPHGSPIPTAATNLSGNFNLNPFSWKTMQPALPGLRFHFR